ncbi:MAG: hypothetical protein V1904_01310 [Bacteroidota bacterium]
MKKTPTFVLLFSIICASAITVKAQYLTGIGATLGLYGRGLTIIQYFAPKDRGAADFLITNQFKGYVFTGLYEIHNPNHSERIEVANVGFFAGIGGHAGAVTATEYKNVNTTKKKIFVVGIDVIAGVEWKLPHIPLLLSINAKPFLDLNYIKQQPDWLDAAITLRLLF